MSPDERVPHPLPAMRTSLSDVVSNPEENIPDFKQLDKSMAKCYLLTRCYGSTCNCDSDHQSSANSRPEIVRTMAPDVAKLQKLDSSVVGHRCVPQNSLPLMIDTILSSWGRVAEVECESDELPEAACRRVDEQGKEGNHQASPSSIESDGSCVKTPQRSIDPEALVNVLINDLVRDA